MDFPVNSPSPSSNSSSTATPHRFPTNTTTTTTTTTDPMHSWWESVSKQRSRILSLSSFLHHADVTTTISSLADSDRPALSLLSSLPAYSSISSAISHPTSGSGSDPLCHWLYDTYLSGDNHLRRVVLSFLPVLSATYLSRIHSSDASSMPSLAGFEAVVLAVYSAEVKSRAGKPILVHVPDLSQPSLYHTPRERSCDVSGAEGGAAPSVGVLSPPLEPQIAVKSTKRASIIGVTFHCYFKEISQMPAWSKLDFCRFAAAWAGQDCHCKDKIENETNRLQNHSDQSNGDASAEIEEEMAVLAIKEKGEPPEVKGVRIPLPWELLQPTLRILGHCLLGPSNSEEVKDAASDAVRSLYARASHDLNPQAILATRSLVNLDKSSRAAAKAAAAAAAAGTNASSNANTPTKAKKPEILLASK